MLYLQKTECDMCGKITTSVEYGENPKNTHEIKTCKECHKLLQKINKKRKPKRKKKNNGKKKNKKKNKRKAKVEPLYSPWRPVDLDSFQPVELEKEEIDHEIAFLCSGCEKEIIKDSREHDNCVTADGEKWFCLDCSSKKQYDSPTDCDSSDEEFLKKLMDAIVNAGKEYDSLF